LIKLNAHPEIQQVETMFPDAGRFNQAWWPPQTMDREIWLARSKQMDIGWSVALEREWLIQWAMIQQKYYESLHNQTQDLTWLSMVTRDLC
jgi:hypothetical protein